MTFNLSFATVLSALSIFVSLNVAYTALAAALRTSKDVNRLVNKLEEGMKRVDPEPEPEPEPITESTYNYRNPIAPKVPNGQR